MSSTFAVAVGQTFDAERKEGLPHWEGLLMKNFACRFQVDLWGLLRSLCSLRAIFQPPVGRAWKKELRWKLCYRIKRWSCIVMML